MKRLLCLILLAGCTAQPGSPPANQDIQSLLTNLKAVSIVDLQNAENIAVVNNDTLMMPCYPALIQFVNTFAGPSGTVSGAFSAFETARVTRIGLTGGLPDYLKLGCAAGLIDEQLFIARLAAMLGAAAVLGPVVPAVVPLEVPAPLSSAPPSPPTAPLAAPAVKPPRPNSAPVRPASVVDPASTALSEMAKTDRVLALARR